MSAVAEARPAETAPPADIWYRGWEISHDLMAGFWCGEGWRAYKGGCDLDAPTVSARTFRDCLDAIDDEIAA